MNRARGITQKELKEIISYCPETGTFRWIQTRYKSVAEKGMLAGGTSKTGYHRIAINNKRYQSHLLAWLYVYGCWPDGEIDHINHDRSDNRICNLRVVDSSGNKKNLSLASNNASGITGVYWYERYKAWSAQIQVDGKVIYLGRSANMIDAAALRKSAEKRYGFHDNHGTKAA